VKNKAEREATAAKDKFEAEWAKWLVQLSVEQDAKDAGQDVKKDSIAVKNKAEEEAKAAKNKIEAEWKKW